MSKKIQASNDTRTEIVPTVASMPVEGHVPNLQVLYLKNRPRQQVFTVNPARRTVLVGEQGTRVTLPAFAFGRVAAPYVEVRMTELLGLGDYLLAGRAAGGKNISPRAQIQLKVLINGAPQESTLPLQVEVPLDSRPRVGQSWALFSEAIPTLKAVRGGQVLEWRQISGKVTPVRQAARDYLSFCVTAPGWYCCAAVQPQGSGVMVSAKPALGALPISACQAFVLIPAQSALIGMYQSGRGFAALQVPANANVQVVAAGVWQGQLYLGISNARKAREKVFRMDMELVTPAVLKTRIKELCG